jgi:hypothetical protein
MSLKKCEADIVEVKKALGVAAGFLERGSPPFSAAALRRAFRHIGEASRALAAYDRRAKGVKSCAGG